MADVYGTCDLGHVVLSDDVQMYLEMGVHPDDIDLNDICVACEKRRRGQYATITKHRNLGSVGQAMKDAGLIK